MNKMMMGATLALGLATATLAGAAPAAAANIVGVQVGPLGFAISNGHYYDNHHRRVAYRYPSDWKTYHHSQSWYRSHRGWDDEKNANWYRH